MPPSDFSSERTTGATTGTLTRAPADAPRRRVHERLAARASDRQRVHLGVAILIGIAWAAFLYEPWRAPPLAVVDWSETLPLLTGSRGFGDAFAAIWRVYAEGHGRFCPVFYAFLVAQWSLFGQNPLGWQLVEFGVMTANLLLALALMRRLMPGIAGPLAGATVFVCGAASLALWVGLHYGEPLAFTFTAAAALLAASYEGSARWLVHAGAIALLLVLAALTRETAIAAVPFVILLALCRRGDGWTLPAVTRRNAALVAVIALALLVGALLPIYRARVLAPTGSYSTHYTTTVASATTAWAAARGMFLPFSDRLTDPANLVYLAVVLAGTGMALRRALDRRTVIVPLLVALSLPIAGTVLYTPWFYYRADYGYTFALGPALLFAFGVGWIMRYSSVLTRAAVLAGCLAAGLFGSRFAVRTARDSYAWREVYAQAVRALPAEMRRLDAPTVYLVVNPGYWYTSWFAWRLELYARAILETPLPPMQHVPCSAAPGLAARDSSGIFLVPSNACGLAAPEGAATRTFARGWRYPSLGRLGMQHDTAKVELWVPPEQPSAGAPARAILQLAR